MTSTRTQSGPTSPLALLHELADNWWLVLLRGIAAIAFGILAFFWPAIALVTLVFLWGTYALVDGVLALGAAIAGIAGAVIGTHAGHAARLAAIARIGPYPAAIVEDLVAIGLATFIVTH